MAKKGGTKGAASFDYHMLTSEQKAKVYTLSDMYPEAVKDHLAIVLSHYDFDQEEAMNAMTTDGGHMAMNAWNSMQSNQVKVSNKNKKKNKKKNRKDNGSILGLAATDAEDSSSLHSSNIDYDGEKETNSKPEYCDESAEKVDESVSSMCNSIMESLCEDPQLVDESECHDLDSRVETPEGGKSDDSLLPSLDVDSAENVMENVERLSPKEDREEHSRHDYRNPSKNTKYPQRQRHGSSHHSKSSSISEDHNPQTSQTTNLAKNKIYMRSVKDLSRQSVSLQNIQGRVESHLEEASKCIKIKFSELKGLIDKRQAEVELQMAAVKEEAMNLLRSRLELASELKVRVNQALNAPESEWLDLKGNIKQFVTERKYDDMLGKTTWFMWSRDGIVEEIQKFGEVAVVKNAYSQRNSSHSRNQSSPELSRQDSDLKADDGVPQEQTDVESSGYGYGREGEMKTEKEVSTKTGQGTYNRVFSNSNYHQYNPRFPNQGRGRGGFRGRGGGYSRRPPQEFRQFGGGGDRYHNRQGPQYNQGKSDHRQANAEYRQANTEHRQPNVDHRQANADHRQANAGHRQANAEHRQSSAEHRQVNVEQHRQPSAEHRQPNVDYQKSLENSVPNANESNTQSSGYINAPREMYDHHSNRFQHRGNRPFGGRFRKNNNYYGGQNRQNMQPRSETVAGGGEANNNYDQSSQEKSEVNGY